jgi:cytochrome P450
VEGVDVTSTVHDEVAGDFDPLDPRVVRDPHAVYAELRLTCPVARGGRWGGFWALLRYADVVTASAAPTTFSSAEGIVIPRNPVSGRRAPMHYDPPEHTAHRRPLNPPFRDEQIGELEPDIRGLARRYVGAFVAAGGGDFVGEVASPYATAVLTRFLNLDEAEATGIQQLSERFEHAQKAEDTAMAESVSQELYGLARSAVAARRAQALPARDDVISALLADGRSEESVTGTVRQLLIAGHVPVVLALGSAVRHLAADEDLQSRLRAQPESIVDALEELLRLYTPNEGFARTAVRDIELAGRTVRAGDRVALVYTAANRDPAAFTDPDRLILGRSPNRHLAFGHGAHKCVGATLARTEMRILLDELLVAGRFTLAGEPTWSHWPEYGPARLPVAIRRTV